MRDAKVTGGGPPTIILKDWQEKFFSVLPKVTIEGFNGIDNFKSMTSSFSRYVEDTKVIDTYSVERPISNDDRMAAVENPITGKQGQKRKYESKCSDESYRIELISIERESLQVEKARNTIILDISNLLESLVTLKKLKILSENQLLQEQ
ncbi:uncharacterized protein LOC127861458 [Dreissena polymorpha]|uniref:uncharacterized protein LOC127861458 n=1 Tax=Dreissena polymorpha TaxID=45954 RepID=UPI002264BCFB|nr:uncharacterized protein LOC127861458 [Dreissena polymorpha]